MNEEKNRFNENMSDERKRYIKFERFTLFYVFDSVIFKCLTLLHAIERRPICLSAVIG